MDSISDAWHTEHGPELERSTYLYEGRMDTSSEATNIGYTPPDPEDTAASPPTRVQAASSPNNKGAPEHNKRNAEHKEDPPAKISKYAHPTPSETCDVEEE